MKIDRNALEFVLQAGGELQNASVFGARMSDLKVVFSSKCKPDRKSLTTDEFNELLNLLFSCVSKTLENVQDERIGFLLSGGVDSSLLLYLIKQKYPEIDITAYHTDWKIPERSEIELAKLAAEFARVPLKIIDTSVDAQLPVLHEALIECKTISYTMAPVYMAMKAMKEDGVRVVINALGIDELFAGYAIHRWYYHFYKSPHVIPYIRSISYKRLYRALARRWGTKKAWFMIYNFPASNIKFVKECTIDMPTLYESAYKADSLWIAIHNLLIDKMVTIFVNMISRAGWANDVQTLFPYLDQDFVEFSLALPISAKYNKAPIRFLMRHEFRFPELIVSHGEQWEKIGWGGTPLPYFTNKRYLDAITPVKDTSKDWFTTKAIRYLDHFQDEPTVYGLYMLMFLKMLELLE